MEVVSKGRQQPHIRPQQAQVVGNVPAHTPQAHPDGAGIGIRRHQRAEGTAADVHIDASHHHGVGAGAQHIPPAGDIALGHQVGDVHRHRGPGDAQLLGDGLLGNHGIRFDHLQNLPLALGHGTASSNHKLII